MVALSKISMVFAYVSLCLISLRVVDASVLVVLAPPYSLTVILMVLLGMVRCLQISSLEIRLTQRCS